jgi:hypothetical protein
MHRHCLGTLTLGACLALAGCAIATRSDESEVSTVGDPHVVTGLVPVLGDHDAPFPATTRGRTRSLPMIIPSLFGKPQAGRDFLVHRSFEEKRIASACAASKSEELPAPPSVMLDRTGAAPQGYVEKKFEKYAVAYAVQTQYPFYHAAVVGRSGFAPELAVRCFRLVRYDAKADEIRFDVIFQMRLDSFAGGSGSYRDAVQIRPLRVYFKRGSYEENRPGDQVSISASLAVDATWFENNRGRSDTVLSALFLSPQTFEASENGDRFRYYGWDEKSGDFTADWSGVERLPLPPVSSGLAPATPDAVGSDDARARDSGRRAPLVTFRVSGAEASSVPAELRLVARLVTPTADLTDIAAGVVKKTLHFPF